MKVRNEIRWLEENKERFNLFVWAVKYGPIRARKLRKRHGTDDWWPMKVHIKDLIERGLVEEAEEGYRSTASGEKVFESLKAVHDIESV